ncbi:hypothetical protein [Salininema proteolyticum]|uniref:Uncharacterized protein n=1 Tax=Salininema proteolyticum TaxID=1607685 RepID=A0ABV8TT84_9ACTN
MSDNDTRPAWLPRHWVSILLLFLGLAAANYAARWFQNSDLPDWATSESGITALLVVTAILVLVPVLAGAHWAYHYPQREIVPDVLPTILAACLWSVLVNPVITPGGSFLDLNAILSSFVVTFATWSVGAYVGYLVMVASGFDRHGRELRKTEKTFARKAGLAK